jgi:hypothetical protein
VGEGNRTAGVKFDGLLTIEGSRGSNINLERVKGIEPSLSAWEAAALPLSYTRTLAKAFLNSPTVQFKQKVIFLLIPCRKRVFREACLKDSLIHRLRLHVDCCGHIPFGDYYILRILTFCLRYIESCGV